MSETSMPVPSFVSGEHFATVIARSRERRTDESEMVNQYVCFMLAKDDKFYCATSAMEAGTAIPLGSLQVTAPPLADWLTTRALAAADFLRRLQIRFEVEEVRVVRQSWLDAAGEREAVQEALTFALVYA